MAEIIRIKPFYYIHILDNNSNVTRTEIGPKTFSLKTHESLISGPDPMIIVPPRNYCIIQNPVKRDEENNIVKDEGGQTKLRVGYQEIRFAQDPFPLYPGEKLFGKVAPLQVVPSNTALKLRALKDFTQDGKDYHAGDEWLFKGPGTYYPQIEVSIIALINAPVVKPLQALRLKAKKKFIAENGRTRIAGEEYIHKEIGTYFPDVNEEVIETINAFILTEKKALALRAKQTFTDCFQKVRRAGEEWLITLQDAEAHIPDVSEQIIGEVPVTILSSREYAVVLDSVDPKTGKPRLGHRELRKGQLSFFLRPGERLEAGIQKVHVLEYEEALLLRAREAFEESTQVLRHPGDRWMIYGPTDYVPPVQVEILEKRKAIVLDENEGIYVRDIKSGKVREFVGGTYMLLPYEELWSKELPDIVEELLAKEDFSSPSSGVKGKPPGRDKTRVVVYKVPHNTCVQTYDYKKNFSRIVWGPELVMLGPEEQFTVLSLSGDTPKRAHVIKSLALHLGPDFMTDIVIVETSDHARLSLRLSYNWQFETNKDDPNASKIFSVPDFVGDACKAIASRIRGAVARISFDEFHKTSASMIREALFGKDEETGKIRNRFMFNQNRLLITNIDIQYVTPVDARTQEALLKSVQLAIEITTKSLEAEARQDAEIKEQEARGRLERQNIQDSALAETYRKDLLASRAESAAVEATGKTFAEAISRAEASNIAADTSIVVAKLNYEAQTIKSRTELNLLKTKQALDINYLADLNRIDIMRARELAAIETKKFNQIVGSIGKDTLKDIAEAGPKLQLSLLQSLGTTTVIMTDGSAPLNLYYPL